MPIVQDMVTPNGDVRLLSGVQGQARHKMLITHTERQANYRIVGPEYGLPYQPIEVVSSLPMFVKHAMGVPYHDYLE